MTLEKIASNLEKWQAQQERLQARLDNENEHYEKNKERYNRIVNKITSRMYALKQKIEKYKPYKTYYEREG